ncbi:MAG: hypothetical protein ACLUUO_01610 [Sellimonas intestinalis]
MRSGRIVKAVSVDVRFIEMMPIGYGKCFHGLDNREVLSQLKERYPGLTEAKTVPGAGYGPAVYVQIPGFLGRTGLISPIHGKFCKDCNRLRLTSVGRLKYCLCYEDSEDLRALVRSPEEVEKRQEKIRKVFREATERKPGSTGLKRWNRSARRKRCMRSGIRDGKGKETIERRYDLGGCGQSAPVKDGEPKSTPYRKPDLRKVTGSGETLTPGTGTAR